jgi:hypothetical protein
MPLSAARRRLSRRCWACRSRTRASRADLGAGRRALPPQGMVRELNWLNRRQRNVAHFRRGRPRRRRTRSVRCGRRSITRAARLIDDAAVAPARRRGRLRSGAGGRSSSTVAAARHRRSRAALPSVLASQPRNFGQGHAFLEVRDPALRSMIREPWREIALPWPRRGRGGGASRSVRVARAAGGAPSPRVDVDPPQRAGKPHKPSPGDLRAVVIFAAAPLRRAHAAVERWRRAVARSLRRIWLPWPTTRAADRTCFFEARAPVGSAAGARLASERREGRGDPSRLDGRAAARLPRAVRARRATLAQPRGSGGLALPERYRLRPPSPSRAISREQRRRSLRLVVQRVTALP